LRILSVVLIPCLLALISCSVTADYESARKASERFHELMDRRGYGALFDQSSAELRSSWDKTEFMVYLAKVEEKLGKCSGDHFAKGVYLVSTSGKQITTISTRTCDKGALREQFDWKIERQRAALFRYAATSPILAAN
jgi:hypothetical protein